MKPSILLAQEFRDFSRVTFASRGFSVKIIEASDRAGGRIKTDALTDSGSRFQVLLTSYPEAQMLLDYEALQLKTLPGASYMMEVNLK
jgi:phytoene dehydrogenase-like protein